MLSLFEWQAHNRTSSASPRVQVRLHFVKLRPPQQRVNSVLSLYSHHQLPLAHSKLSSLYYSPCLLILLSPRIYYIYPLINLSSSFSYPSPPSFNHLCLAMSTSGFAKVTGTTSMSNFDRREVRKRRKELRNSGNTSASTAPANPNATPINTTPAAPPSGPPKRAGLRGVKYAFFPDRAPVPIVPHKNVTAPHQNTVNGQISTGQGGKVTFIIYSACT